MTKRRDLVRMISEAAAAAGIPFEVVKEYHANATRDGRFWIIDVPEIGQTTQARTTAEAEAMTRDLISVVLEIPSNTYAVTMHYMLPAGVVEHLDRAERLRKEAAHANSAAAAEVRRAAAELKDGGLGLRDIGRVMGVSYQRAGQLVNHMGRQPIARLSPVTADVARMAALVKARTVQPPRTAGRRLPTERITLAADAGSNGTTTLAADAGSNGTTTLAADAGSNGTTTLAADAGSNGTTTLAAGSSSLDDDVDQQRR